MGNPSEIRSRVSRLPLTISQSYLIHAVRPVLVDVGLTRDESRVLSWLDHQGVAPHEPGAIVLTHAHADHAGAIAAIAQRARVPVIVGAADVPTLRNGGEARWHRKKGLGRTFARLGLLQAYPPLPGGVDVVPVSDVLSLDPFGAKATVFPVSGHTPGSIAVVLASGEAMVGDMVIGGYLLGRVGRARPVSHYFHADRARNLASLNALLDTGAHTWHLGHGGPLTAAAIRSWLRRSPRG